MLILKALLLILAFVVHSSSRLEDSWNTFVFPLAILLEKEERLFLAPIYLRFLFTRPNECVVNTVCSVGCYDVVTHTDTSFL